MDNLNDYEGMKSPNNWNSPKVDKNQKFKEMMDYAAANFSPVISMDTLRYAILELAKW